MKSLRRTLLLLVSYVWLAAGVASGEPNRNVYFVSEAEVSGDYQDIKIVGDSLYCANSYGVVVWTFDENNPEDPPVEIERFSTPGQATSLFIVDTLCYVADGSRGLRIFDISDLSPIEELGACEEVGSLIGVVVKDRIAYCISYRSGIYTIDVEDPSNPVRLGFFRTFIEKSRLIVQDEYLWTAPYDRGSFLTVFDVTEPRDIRQINQFLDNGCGSMFSFVGDTAFVPSGTLNVLNIQQPDSISIITQARPAGYVGALFHDGYLYGDDGIFSIVDVRNLNNIRFLSRILAYGLTGTGMMDFRENHIFAPAKKRGLKIVNVEDKNRPFIQHVNLTNSWFKDIAYKEGFLYVADAQSGVWPVQRVGDYYQNGRMKVYSVDDPYHPVLIADIDTLPDPDVYDGGSSMIEVKDSIAIIGGQIGLMVFNINDPANPECLFRPSINWIGTGDHPTFHGDNMFVALGEITLRIYSIANPSQPNQLITYRSGQLRHNKVFVEGDYLIITGELVDNQAYKCVFTYDWRDIGNIHRVGEMSQINGDMLDGVRFESYLYLIGGSWSSGLSVVSIEDPLHPHEVYFSNEVRNGHRAEIIRRHLFIADGNYGIRIFDLEDPERPRQVGYYDTPDFASGVAVDEERGFMFVADQSDLSVYDVGALIGVWDLTVEPERLEFGEGQVGDTLRESIVVTNLAQDPVLIDSVLLAGIGFSIGNHDSIDLAPNEDLQIEIVFTPDTVGSFPGLLEVYSMNRVRTVELTGVGSPLSTVDAPGFPVAFELHSVYPNPFNTTTIIRYDIPLRSQIRLTVYDLAGREVETLLSGEVNPGRHSTVWNSRSNPAGIYFVRFESIGKTTTSKALLIK